MTLRHSVNGPDQLLYRAHGKTAQDQGEQRSCENTDDSRLDQKGQQAALRPHVEDTGFDADEHDGVADNGGQDQQKKNQACYDENGPKGHAIAFFHDSASKICAL